jgi:hypothetical protein
MQTLESPTVGTHVPAHNTKDLNEIKITTFPYVLLPNEARHLISSLVAEQMPTGEKIREAPTTDLEHLILA